MIKRFTLLFLLILPVVVRAQTPITPSFSRVATQTGWLDSLRIKYSGQLQEQWLWSSAQIRNYLLNAPHTFNSAQSFTGTLGNKVIIDGSDNGSITFTNQAVLSGRAGGGLSTFTNGVLLYGSSAADQWLHLESGNNFAPNFKVTTAPSSPTDVVRLQDISGGSIPVSNTNYTATGTAGNGYYRVLTQSISPAKNASYLTIYRDSINRFSYINGNYRRTFAVPRSVDRTITYPYVNTNPILADSSDFAARNSLKQPRIISALPTQTTTRPLVGDSVNQAIQKLTFRGDSLSAAVSLKLNKNDTTAAFAPLLHRFGPAQLVSSIITFTAQTNTASLIPNSNGSSDLGTNSLRYNVGYINLFYGGGVRFSTSIFTISNSSNTAIAGWNNSTGNLTNGSTTDLGYKIAASTSGTNGYFSGGTFQINASGQPRLTALPTGTAGTDSILVKHPTTNLLEKIAANYYLPASSARVPVILSGSITIALNSDYLSTSSTQYTLTVPATTGFATQGSQLITALATGTGGLKIVCPSGYTIQTPSGNVTPVTGSATLSQNQKVQLIPIGSNAYYLQPLNGTITVL